MRLCAHFRPQAGMRRDVAFHVKLRCLWITSVDNTRFGARLPARRLGPLQGQVRRSLRATVPPGRDRGKTAGRMLE